MGVQFDDSQDIDVQVFHFMKDNFPLQNKDRRCSFARFLSAVSKPEECLGRWAQDRLHRTYLGIETDALRGKKLGACLKSASVVSPQHDDHAHTNPNVMDIVDKRVRDSCANAISVSVMMLAKEEHRRICLIVVTACAKLKHWEGHSCCALRDMKGCIDWAVDQCSGGFMVHLNEMVEQLSHPAVIQQCGFFVTITRFGF